MSLTKTVDWMPSSRSLHLNELRLDVVCLLFIVGWLMLSINQRYYYLASPFPSNTENAERVFPVSSSRLYFSQQPRCFRGAVFLLCIICRAQVLRQSFPVTGVTNKCIHCSMVSMRGDKIISQIYDKQIRCGELGAFHRLSWTVLRSDIWCCLIGDVEANDGKW